MLSELLKAGILITLILVSVPDGVRGYGRYGGTGTGKGGKNSWIPGAAVGAASVITAVVFIICRCYISKKKGVPFCPPKKTGVQPTTNVHTIQSHPAAPSDSSAKGAHTGYNTVYGNGSATDYNTAYGNGGPPPAYTYSDPADPPQK